MKNAEMKVVPIGGDVIATSWRPSSARFLTDFNAFYFNDNDSLNGFEPRRYSDSGVLEYHVSYDSESALNETWKTATVYLKNNEQTTGETLLNALSTAGASTEYNGLYAFDGSVFRWVQ